MPELPEAECVRRALRRAMVGRVITRLDVRRDDFVRAAGAGPENFAGTRCVRVVRKGKRVGILTSRGPAMEIRLGMSGQPRLLNAGEAEPEGHVHAVVHLERRAEAPQEPARLALRDVRRFGGVSLLPGRDELEANWRTTMGPDALTIGPRVLHAGLAMSRRAVKAALLDQGAVAGLGNIYADEALHRAGVSPRRRGADVGPAESARLANEIRRVLVEAIRRGGSTLRDYQDPLGRLGGFATTHAVYGRGGEPCLGCGETLETAGIGGRTTVWCARCQR